VDIGSSYLPSDLLAAFLLAQLEEREEIQRKRRRIWEYYWKHLQGPAQESNVRLPVVPPECEQAYHMFYLILPSLEYRQALIAHLKENGILSVFHYVPLHLSAMGMKFGARDCPVAEDVSARLLRLPFYNDLAEEDQSHIVGSTVEFFRQKRAVSRAFTL
jgi:dTDP-4-amino-4,6-dideoxygalactose transaminase